MPDLNEIVNSAAVLIKQSEQLEGEARDTLRGAARTLLETVNIHLAPGATPAPDPVPDEED